MPEGVENRPSAIEGAGLFATRDFRTGERIAPYSGPASSAPVASPDGKVFSLEIRPGLWIDGSGRDNAARHANHSCDPNAELVWDDKEGAGWLTARREILPGQEITFDYGFSLADSLAHPCRCGSPACAGRIIAAPLRAALRRHLRPPGTRRD